MTNTDKTLATTAGTMAANASNAAAPPGLNLEQQETMHVNRFRTAASDIKAIVETGRKLKTDMSDVSTFKGMMASIDAFYAKCELYWDNLLVFYLGAGMDDKPADSEKNRLANAKRYYFECQAIHLEISRPPPATVSPHLPSADFTFNSSATDGGSRYRLPKISLPRFSGNNLEEWPLFRDAFQSMVHNDMHIRDMDKFHYLVGCLSDKALAVIRAVPCLETNYHLAWNALTKRFDHKRTLARSYISCLLNFKPLSGKAPVESLSHFLSTIPQSIAAFQTLAIRNPEQFILFELGVRLLDPTTREAFEIKNAMVDYPTFDSLVDFVQQRCLALKISEEGVKGVSTSKTETEPRRLAPNQYNSRKPNSSPGHQVLLTTGTPESVLVCPLCGSPHVVSACQMYSQASIAERYELLRRHKCCFNCLRATRHLANTCPSRYNCSRCNRRHHTSLHTDTSSSTTPASTSVVPDQIVSAQVCCETDALDTKILLGTVSTYFQGSGGVRHRVRILLDSGSQHSLMTQACANKLGLTPTRTDHTVVGLGQNALQERLGSVRCAFETKLANSPPLTTHALVVHTITGGLPQIRVPISILKKLDPLNLADPDFWKPGPIDVLLGADVYTDIVIGKPRSLSPTEPSVIATIFGDIVMGRYTPTMRGSAPSVVNCCVEDVNSTLKGFWEIEEPCIPTVSSPQNDFCESHFQSTHYRNSEGRYVVSLPFNGYQQELGASKSRSLSRLINLENKLKKKVQVKVAYDAFMREYLDLEHMRKALEPGTCILPHHAVYKANDIEGKIRVVFDASAQTSHRSLNECMYAGPKLQLDISSILLNFRRHRYVFTTDIKKMYRQILINPDETRFQHIYWRFQPEHEVVEFELLTLTYGMICAPFIALRVIKQLIQDEGPSCPQAAEVLTSDIYIDDIVSGTSSFSQALSLIQQLVVLLRKGGFELGKWSSNSSSLLRTAKVAEEDSLLNIASGEEPMIKILGLQWNPVQDTFTYIIRAPPTETTKRMVLATIARLYDPLGFLAPVIFTAKIILQKIWLSGIDWDEEVPSHLKLQWQEYLAQLPCLTTLNIPRFLRLSDDAMYHVLGFADASERGYAATVYLRVKTPAQISVFLLKAKTKLAPLNPVLTVPRLELCGALLLTSLLPGLQGFMEHLGKPPVLLFSDSMTVLSWLRTPQHLLKTYVVNRVNIILENSKVDMWHHVCTNENPADLGSRGLMPKHIIDHNLWWTGPSWAVKPPTTWPIATPAPLSTQDLPDIKVIKVVSIATDADLKSWTLERWMERFSSYQRMVRSLAYIFRFLNSVKAPKKGPLTVEEIEHATQACIRNLQKTNYPDGDRKHESLFKGLNVFKDEVGLFRVGGRLRHSDQPFAIKHPLLLPRRSHFNNLLIDFHHRLHLHVGNQALQAILQTQYWIPACRDLIRSRTRLCKRCFTLSAKPQPPYMGDLPASRLRGETAFLNVGIDFAGPFLCRTSDRRSSGVTKAYLCIFVCFSTKALHVEVAHRLTTEAFLDCLERFVSRRGKPAHIYSDCGTNFVGAANYLAEIADWLNSDSVRRACMEFTVPQGIVWHFNPPGTPHFGGLWEAGVKSVKSLLWRTLGSLTFTERELNTIVTKIESILNSRPLTPLSSDPNDFQALTPGHFLIGRPLTSYPEEDLTEENEDRLSRWQLVRQRIQFFWSRWRHEYCQTLQVRRKWTEPRPNLQVGDMVLLSDPKAPPLNWALARVVTLHPGSDDVVRIVTIRTSKGIYQRPVSKLVLLPLLS